MKHEPGAAAVNEWLVEPLSDDVRHCVRRLRRLPGVARIAIMPDVHLAEQVCVGAVIATRGTLFPAAVGSDIGCGISAVALAGPRQPWDPTQLRAVLAGWDRDVPSMRHRSIDAAPAWPQDLDPSALSELVAPSLVRREGRIELGTLGRGNHFLELQIDEHGAPWLMVHSGSRVIGQVITRAHLRNATRASGGVFCLNAESNHGRSYRDDVAWAIRYAAASRRLMLTNAAAVAEAELGLIPDWSTLIDSNHNHVREETHEGEALLVHRKGAGAAALDEQGLIPGSMGTESYHVTGRGCAAALGSSSHGAGRAMRRAEARKRIRESRVREELQGVIFDERLIGALVEEAPSAYKDIHAVMRAQRDLVRIVRRLRTVVSYKGV